MEKLKQLIAKINDWLHNDKELLYLTFALIIVGGLVRMISMEVSRWIILGAFLPYFIMRGLFYLHNRHRKWTNPEKQRFFVLLLLFVAVALNLLTTILNVFPRFRAEFLILFLLMVDYLFVTNEKHEEAGEGSEKKPDES